MARLTIRQMEYFDSLAETLHFGRAAALAGVTQPALSAQIAEMEVRLGCRLFERGDGAVRLTEEGRALRPRVERILADIHDLESVARRGRQVLEGRFRLGIIPTVAPYLLPTLLPELKRHYPALQLELQEALTGTLLEETASGRLDAMIAALPLDEPALAVEALFEDRFLLAVSEHDPAFVAPPVPPDSPALERLMLLEEGHCMREQALAVCGKVKPVAMASYGATSLTTLMQMVAHGLGVTLIPEMATKLARAIPDLKVVPFAEPAPARTICLAWRKSSGRREDCAAFAKTLGKLRSEHEITREEGRPALANALGNEVYPDGDVE